MNKEQVKITEKLGKIIFSGYTDDIIVGILNTYFKHQGILTNFDILYINKKHTEIFGYD